MSPFHTGSGCHRQSPSGKLEHGLEANQAVRLALRLETYGSLRFATRSKSTAHSQSATIFSRGVFGAARCLTDANVREENESYLAECFPGEEFAMLLQDPVVTTETLSPDLQNPQARPYEGAPNRDGRR
jgi:hypothetical protein